MQRPGSTTDSAYDYEYSCMGETIRLGVHCSGVAHEPRVCWKVGEQIGICGHVRLDTPESVYLEEGETVWLDDQSLSEIPVPKAIAEELNAAVEKLGTVVVGSNRIAADPAAFPSEIDGFERIGWESERNVMWYWRDERSPPRAYQIERGELVFRAQEWADGVCSEDDLVDRYNLETTY